MENYETKTMQAGICNNWEHLKNVNDIIQKEEKQLGHGEATLKESVNNIQGNISDLQHRMSTVETAMKRPQLLGALNSDQRTSEHKKAFLDYIRKGQESGLREIEKKALSVGSDSDGGFFATSEIEHNINQTLSSKLSLRNLASIQKISTDSLEIIEDYNDAECGWTLEISAINETKTPKLSKKVIPVHEIYAQPKATQKLIDDASISIDMWLQEKLAHSFSELEDIAFVRGDGIGKPKGFLSYQPGKEWGQVEQINSGISGGLNFDSIMKLVYSLPEAYLSRASFLVNRNVTFLLRTLKNDKGDYLWSPGLANGVHSTLLGIPVYHSDAMPNPAKDSLSIALADWKSAYLIIDRNNMKLMRDPFTEKPFVKFYTTKRVGGDVTNYRAIKLLKLS